MTVSISESFVSTSGTGTNTSGIVPFCVWSDPSATTATNVSLPETVYNACHFAHDWGDNATITYDGPFNDKRRYSYTPTAAHVYYEAGSYTKELIVTSSNGSGGEESDTNTQAITAYALDDATGGFGQDGYDIVAINPFGDVDFSWLGSITADTQTTAASGNNLDTEITGIAQANRCILIKNDGTRWSGSNTLSVSYANLYIGSVSGGTKPVLEYTGSGNFIAVSGSASNISLFHIEIDGNDTSDHIIDVSAINGICCYEVTFTDQKDEILSGGSSATSPTTQNRIAFINCSSVTSLTGPNPRMDMFGGMRYLFMGGCDWDRTGREERQLRINPAQDVYITNCKFHGGCTQSRLRIRGANGANGSNVSMERNELHSCVISGGEALELSSATAGEELTSARVQNNFIVKVGQSTPLINPCAELGFYNNIIWNKTAGATVNMQVINTSQRNVANANLDSIFIDNNFVFDDQSTGQTRFVIGDSHQTTGSEPRLRNNVIWKGSGSIIVFVASGTVVSASNVDVLSTSVAVEDMVLTAPPTLFYHFEFNFNDVNFPGNIVGQATKVPLWETFIYQIYRSQNAAQDIGPYQQTDQGAPGGVATPTRTKVAVII